MFLKFDLNILIPKLLIASFFSKIIEQHVRVVHDRWTCGSGKETFKYLQALQKSLRFSLSSPFSQLKEKSCLPVFIKCGEPRCRYQIYKH